MTTASDARRLPRVQRTVSGGGRLRGIHHRKREAA